MSKLIGTNPNQVPSNADLGTAAFMDAKDFLTSRGSSLSAIDAVIPTSSTRLFVYDTSLDSDGGAWRKRTQNTSWYNEPLNTLTRGSRREFPAVALIVAETSTNGKVTIYDADDPTLPMWMVFENVRDGSRYSLLRWATSGNSTPRDVKALNGNLAIVGDNIALMMVKFISDDVQLAWTAGSWQYNHGIARRNDIKGITTNGDGYTLGSYDTDVIAMKVLPGSSIDKDTGLPRPTLAIGSGNADVDVIKHDENRVQITHTWNGTFMIDFDKDNDIVMHLGNATGQGLIAKVPVPTTNLDISSGGNYVVAGGNIYNSARHPTLGNDLGGLGTLVGDENGVSTNAKNNGELNLVRVWYDETGRRGNVGGIGNSVAYINDDFNTGWMKGDVSFATMCSTGPSHPISSGDDINYATTVTYQASGRLTNNTYTEGATSWSMTDDASNTSGYIELYLNGLTPGKHYYVEVTVDQTAGYADGQPYLPRWDAGSGGDTKYFTNWDYSVTTSTTLTNYFRAVTANNDHIVIYCSDTTTNFSNFRIIEADTIAREHSRYGSCLIPVGTVPTSKVAPGADMLAYGPFDNSNYLLMPHEPELDVGTGDIAFIFWIYPKASGTENYVLDRRDGNEKIEIRYLSTGVIRVYTSNNYTDSGTLTLNEWNQIVCVRKQGTSGWRVFKNGTDESSIQVSASSQDDVTSPNRFTTIFGKRRDNQYPGTDIRLSMFRATKTVPSAEEIRKMYYDEFKIFQPSTKASLNGSNVNAMGFDKVTHELHCGNGTGTSTFQGLVRIDYTDEVKTSSISAANGLVAKE